MKDHSNGRENATQLEQRLADYGVLFHIVNDNGFIVIGDDRIFIVNEANPTKTEGFSFQKIPFDAVERFHVELGKPDDRYDQSDAEKVSDGDPAKPTHIRLWLPTDAVDCYVDADPREVASSFVTFTLENE